MTPSTPLSAIGLMLLAVSFIPLGDTAGKLLTAQHGVAPGFVAWSRFVLGALLLLPFLRGAGLAPSLLADWRIWLRGGLVSAGILCILTALRTEGMATVFGAFFIGPLLSYFLAAALLGEPITRAQTLLLFAGFGGVLMVVQPGFGMTVGTGFALAAGLCYGGFLTASRWLRERARPRAMLAAQLIVGAVLLAPAGVLGGMPTASVEIGLLTLGSAAGSLTGNLFLILAYRRAHASKLAPFVYAQLIMATLLGLVVFGDWPDAVTLAGLAVLIAAGLSSLLVRPDAGITGAQRAP